MQSLQSTIQKNLNQLIQQLEKEGDFSADQKQKLLDKLTETKDYFQRFRKWVESAQKISDLGAWEDYHQKNEIFWSEETYRIFGFAPYSVTPSYELFIDCVHPEDRERIEKAYKKSLQNGEFYHVVFRMMIPQNL